MTRVAVLMSYYNGDRYIKEQIESILNQELTPETVLDLYVRDDGSPKSDLAVVKDYQAQGKLTLFQDPNCGVVRSFYTLMEKVAGYDYYFFSDQDDVWLPEKVQTMVDEMKKWEGEPAVPVGVFSDLAIADQDAKPTGVLMKHDDWAEFAGNPQKLSQASIISNKVTGASFAFNQAARDAAVQLGEKIFCSTYMHDSTMALLVTQQGKLVYLDQPLVYYRQHGNNVIGYRKRKTMLDKVTDIKEIYKHKVTRLFEYYLIERQQPNRADRRFVEAEQMFTRRPLHSLVSAWHLRDDLYGPHLVSSELLFLFFGVPVVAKKQAELSQLVG